MNKDFIQGLEENIPELLIKTPKSDLHCHGALSFRLAALEKLIGKVLPKPPKHFPRFADFEQYIGEVIAPYCHSKGNVEALYRAALEQAKLDGITRFEMSVDCLFSILYPNGALGLAEAIDRLHRETAPDMDFRATIGFARDPGPKEVNPHAEACIETGYFYAVDLYGTETAYTPKDFLPVYRKAKASGMRLKAHAGEYGSAESVREMVDLFGLHEVEHGISAADSKEVMRYLSQNNIQLNICPTSNVALGRAGSIASHPVRKLFDNGVRVTVNSDDIIIFGQSVNEEFMNLYRAGVFSAPELDTIREWGLE